MLHLNVSCKELVYIAAHRIPYTHRAPGADAPDIQLEDMRDPLTFVAFDLRLGASTTHTTVKGGHKLLDFIIVCCTTATVHNSDSAQLPRYATHDSFCMSRLAHLVIRVRVRVRVRCSQQITIRLGLKQAERQFTGLES